MMVGGGAFDAPHLIEQFFLRIRAVVGAGPYRYMFYVVNTNLSLLFILRFSEGVLTFGQGRGILIDGIFNFAFEIF